MSAEGSPVQSVPCGAFDAEAQIVDAVSRLEPARFAFSLRIWRVRIGKVSQPPPGPAQAADFRLRTIKAPTPSAWPGSCVGGVAQPPQDLVALLRGQHAELIAIGIGHDHPAGPALADVDARRTK
jgi:hypothetical protein